MSYDIEDGVRDAEEYALFLKQLKELYPKAYRDGDRWVASALSVEDCDGFRMRSESHPSTATLVYADLYRTIGTGRVYRVWGSVLLDAFVFEIQTKDPEFYGKLLQKLKDTVKT